MSKSRFNDDAFGLAICAVAIAFGVGMGVYYLSIVLASPEKKEMYRRQMEQEQREQQAQKEENPFKGMIWMSILTGREP